MENLRALVLNNAYEPLQFTGMRRALVLVIKGKAEAVESDGFFYRTVSETFRLPTVVRLYRYVNRPRRIGVSFSKKNVLRRDGYTCQYCGHTGKDLTIDHVAPRSSGGLTSWENVVAACRKCNLRKGNKSLPDSGMELLRKPAKPSFIVHAHMPENTPKTHLEAWMKYLPKSKTDYY
ncbi:MAG: HNH endonuclease [Nitrospinae bacterium]|nr:HNH endonuclease [Nitrospinota bacterium]